jgi:hypothetical protein
MWPLPYLNISGVSYPFNLRFVSDSTEAEFEHLSATPNNRGQLPSGSKGFKFGYAQQICKSTKCFQCELTQFDPATNRYNNEGMCTLTRILLDS